MNVQNADWFVKVGIPFICDGDLKSYRDNITLEHCIAGYKAVNDKLKLDNVYGESAVDIYRAHTSILI